MFGDHIRKYQQEQRARMLSTYNIEKSEENDLEKGGEGSRGGNVVGHSASGKPIYGIKHFDSSHKNMGKMVKDAVKNRYPTGKTEHDTHVTVSKQKNAHHIYFHQHESGRLKQGIEHEKSVEHSSKHYHETAEGLHDHFKKQGYTIEHHQKDPGSYPVNTHHFTATKGDHKVKVKASIGGPYGVVSVKDESH